MCRHIILLASQVGSDVLINKLKSDRWNFQFFTATSSRRYWSRQRKVWWTGHAVTFFSIVRSHECPLKMEISHIFHDSASILPWTHEFWQSYYQKSHESSLYQHMLYLLACIIICSCMANLRKRIVPCYLNQETLTCFEDVYVPPECATDGWNRDRKRCLGSWSQDWRWEWWQDNSEIGWFWPHQVHRLFKLHGF